MPNEANPPDDGRSAWLSWALRRPGRDRYKAELEAELDLLRPLKRLDEMTEPELTAYAGEVATAMVVASNARLAQARQEAAEILEEAERARDEIHREASQHRDEVEAAARTHRAEVAAEAKRSAAAVEAAAEQTRTEAETSARELREEAEADASARVEQATADADRISTEARQAAERLREESQAEASELEELARRTGEEIVAEAITRRDELLETIEQQRRWVANLVSDVSDLRSATIGAVNDVRSLTEAVAARLTAYTNRGEDVLADVESQAARLRSISPTAAQSQLRGQQQAKDDGDQPATG